MTKTTQLYRNVDIMLNDLQEVEVEFLLSGNSKKRAQLARIADRLSIMGEVVRGIITRN